MKKLALIISLGLIVSSCGVFRNVTKDSHAASSDSISAETIYKSVIDTGKTIINETIDTTVTSPAVTINKDFPLNAFPEGQKFPGFINAVFELDTAMVDLKLHYDTLSNSIRVTGIKRLELIPVKLHRTKAIYNGKSKYSTVFKKTEVSKEEVTTAKEIDHDNTWMWACAGLLVVIALVLFLFYKFR